MHWSVLKISHILEVSEHPQKIKAHLKIGDVFNYFYNIWKSKQ